MYRSTSDTTGNTGHAFRGLTCPRLTSWPLHHLPPRVTFPPETVRPCKLSGFHEDFYDSIRHSKNWTQRDYWYIYSSGKCVRERHAITLSQHLLLLTQARVGRPAYKAVNSHAVKNFP